jgi:para-nitrobenzyl esterase
MDEPVVTTTAGAIRAKRRRDVTIFRGIPFAAPPVGARRFRPPAPPLPWDGLREATHASPWAPQLPSPLEKMLGAPPPRWDESACLTLNVTTPAVDRAKRPVMFWIHGAHSSTVRDPAPSTTGRASPGTVTSWS